MAAKIRFYLDENVPVVVARQLQARQIEAVTARGLGMLSVSDATHLSKAKEMDCVLCTNDSDFLRLASEGISHAGIVFGQQDQHYIGEWVNFLTLVHAVYTPEEMVDRVEFL
ncbi:MAG: DUF5615 family PIN-like protein [Caldilineaceae bacterium]